MQNCLYEYLCLILKSNKPFWTMLIAHNAFFIRSRHWRSYDLRYSPILQYRKSSEFSNYNDDANKIRPLIVLSRLVYSISFVSPINFNLSSMRYFLTSSCFPIYLNLSLPRKYRQAHTVSLSANGVFPYYHVNMSVEPRVR